MFARLQLGRYWFAKKLILLIIWQIRSLPFRLVELAQNKYVFWPLLAFTAYIPVGPLMAGNLDAISGLTSYIFVWGIWNSKFGWTFLLDTWLWGAISTTSLLIPSVLLLSVYVSKGSLINCTPMSDEGRKAVRPIHTRAWAKAGIFFWWFLHFAQALSLVLAYGPLCLIAVPSFTLLFVFVSCSILWMAKRGPHSSYYGLSLDKDT